MDVEDVCGSMWIPPTHLKVNHLCPVPFGCVYHLLGKQYPLNKGGVSTVNYTKDLQTQSGCPFVQHYDTILLVTISSDILDMHLVTFNHAEQQQPHAELCQFKFTYVK